MDIYVIAKTSWQMFGLKLRCWSSDKVQCAATGSPGYLCPLSKNMFWPYVPHLEGYLLLKPFSFTHAWHNRSWQVVFAHAAEAKHILHKWNGKKRSDPAVVNRKVSPESRRHCQKSRRDLSLALGYKNKRLYYCSFRCVSPTDTLSRPQHSVKAYDPFL